MVGSDLDEVLEIEGASFSTPWSRGSFRNLLGRRDAELWVAEIGSGVVGYAVVWYMGHEGELGNLAVAPAWRRRGLARQLVHWVTEKASARGVARLFLEVRESNRAAQELYLHSGFVPIGVRRRYYREPVEDALVMSVDLRSPPVDFAGDRLWQAPR